MMFSILFNKTLGTLIMCSVKDIKNRIFLGHVAFSKFEKVWLTGIKISVQKKFVIYEAQVASILLYIIVTHGLHLKPRWKNLPGFPRPSLPLRLPSRYTAIQQIRHLKIDLFVPLTHV